MRIKSKPLHTPPSTRTVSCSPTAAAIAGKALTVDGASSSWRPLWFDTTMSSLDPENNAKWTDRVGIMSECQPDPRFLVQPDVP